MKAAALQTLMGLPDLPLLQRGNAKKATDR